MQSATDKRTAHPARQCLIAISVPLGAERPLLVGLQRITQHVSRCSIVLPAGQSCKVLYMRMAPDLMDLRRMRRDPIAIC